MKYLLKKSWCLIRILLIGCSDILRYVRYSQCVINNNKKKALEAAITRRYHGLEKGLSFTKIKKNFGEKTITELLHLVNIYLSTYGDDGSQAVKNSIVVLRQYVKQHVSNNKDIIESINALLNEDVAMRIQEDRACTLTFTRDYLQQCGKSNFEQLCINRFSIREYTETPIPAEKIEKAIAMAQKSPSACNRQSVRAYYSCDKRKINLIDGFKPGNKGFTNINAIVVLATDLSTHDLPQERHQGFVEAGMFAMTLIYFLQFMGFGSCALHASFTPRAENDFKKIFGINETEALCLMISVGNMQEKTYVPTSCRYPLNEICTNLDK